jgi:hypothetical protein
MIRGVIATAMLAAGCHYDTTVGRLRAPADAEAVDAVDAVDASDAVDAVDAVDASDVGVVAVPDPQREVTGLGSLAPTVSADPRSPTDRFRIYYVDRDGVLWLERRSTATLGLVCATSLGAPDGRALVGRPGAGDRALQAVVAPARDADGRVQFWIREEGAEDGACGGAFSPWAALPRCPYELTSAPAVYQFPIGARFPAGNTYVLASTREGLAMLLRRPGSPSWGAWGLVPGRPPDAQVYGRPGLLEWGDQLEVWTLAAGPSGRPRLLHAIYLSEADRWYSGWLDEALQADDPPATAIDARAFFPAATVANQWLAYTGASGRLWTRTFRQVGPDSLWSSWVSVRSITRGELAAPPSAISIGFARIDGPVSELLVTSAPPDDRRLYVSRRSAGTGWFEPWSPAPDALR